MLADPYCGMLLGDLGTDAGEGFDEACRASPRPGEDTALLERAAYGR